jgi:hypothetical protein
MLQQIRTSSARIIPIVAVGLLAIVLHKPAPAQGGRRAIVVDGETPDLMLLYTGDVIGYIDPCG